VGAEKHDTSLPFWPTAMTRSMALAYTSASEAQMAEWERAGVVRFIPRGPNGAKITERAQLDEAVHALFVGPAEDMRF
jgi:hypothetical protein